jgi:hypothetical protein
MFSSLKVKKESGRYGKECGVQEFIYFNFLRLSMPYILSIHNDAAMLKLLF